MRRPSRALAAWLLAAGCLGPTSTRPPGEDPEASPAPPADAGRDSRPRPDASADDEPRAVADGASADQSPAGDTGTDQRGPDVLSPTDVGVVQRVYRCDRYKTTREVETLLIARTCGGHDCHAGGDDGFDPVLVRSPLAPVLVDKPAHANCATARFIDTRDPEQSFLLIKVRGPGNEVTCPDGKPGGARMPFDKPMLAKGDLDCLGWYVNELVRAATR